MRHIEWVRRIDTKAEVEQGAVAKLLDHHKGSRKCQRSELAECSAAVGDILYATRGISVEIRSLTTPHNSWITMPVLWPGSPPFPARPTFLLAGAFPGDRLPSPLFSMCSRASIRRWTFLQKTSHEMSDDKSAIHPAIHGEALFACNKSYSKNIRSDNDGQSDWCISIR